MLQGAAEECAEWAKVFAKICSRPRVRTSPKNKENTYFYIYIYTVIFEIITFLIQKHFKTVTVTVTVIWGKLIQMTF